MVIQLLMLETGYTLIPFDMYCPNVQTDLPNRIFKDCETFFSQCCCCQKTLEKAITAMILPALLMVMFQKKKMN